MPMSMMHIRKMRVTMPHRAVDMHMVMRHCRVPFKVVFVLVMIVMHVAVPVFHCLMLMVMGVPLRQV